MSILIRGAGLPKSCHNCPCAVELFDYYDNTHSCECNILQKDTTNYSTERRKDCPLVEVPEHHGRLVDLDKLIYDMGLDEARKYGNKTARDRSFSYSTLMRYEIADALEDTPVIIDKE